MIYLDPPYSKLLADFINFRRERGEKITKADAISNFTREKLDRWQKQKK